MSLKPTASEAALCDDYLAAKRNAAEAPSLGDFAAAEAVRQVLEARVVELIEWRKSNIQHAGHHFAINSFRELVAIKIPAKARFRR